MANIHYGVKTSRKQGGPKMTKIQYGVKPDIFKYAAVSTTVWFLDLRRVSNSSERNSFVP